MTILPYYKKHFTTKLTPEQFKTKLWKVTVDWSYTPVHGIDYTYTFFKKVDFDKVEPTYIEAKIQVGKFRLRIQQPFYWKQILSFHLIGKFVLDEERELTNIKVHAQPNLFFVGLSILTLILIILTGNSMLYMLIPLSIYCIIFNLEIWKLDKCLNEILAKKGKTPTQKP